MSERPTRPKKRYRLDLGSTVTTTLCGYAVSEADAYMDHLEASIADLEEQRDTWQRIFNSSEAELTQLRTERDREIAELRDELAEERDEAIAQAEKLAEAVEIIAGERRCVDNLMGNVGIAREALVAYGNRPQVSQDASTSIKTQPIRDTKVAPEATITQEET